MSSYTYQSIRDLEQAKKRWEDTITRAQVQLDTINRNIQLATAQTRGKECCETCSDWFVVTDSTPIYESVKIDPKTGKKERSYFCNKCHFICSSCEQDCITDMDTCIRCSHNIVCSSCDICKHCSEKTL